MNRKLGIAIYPDKTSVESNLEYLTLAAKYGFQRVFTCLLSAEEPLEVIKEKQRVINTHAQKLGFEIIVDVAPIIFQKYNLSPNDLSFFKELNVTGIRLDQAFDGLKESLMTYNQHDLKIELNMSNDTSYVDLVVDHKPLMNNLMGCHNFYPQLNTGLNIEYFTKCSERFKKHNLRTAAFVNSKQATIGPWNITDGLVTLEDHRNLDIDVQAKHLWATNLIDDIIIGNCFASEEELAKLGALNRYLIELNVHMVEKISDVEKSILLDELHYFRGDQNNSMIRSTEVRKKHVNSKIKPRNSEQFSFGDITIGNDQFGKYKGELQICLMNQKETRKNIIAKVIKQEQFLINYISPWTKFKFKEKR